MLIHPAVNRKVFIFCLTNILAKIRHVPNLACVRVLIARESLLDIPLITSDGISYELNAAKAIEL